MVILIVIVFLLVVIKNLRYIGINLIKIYKVFLVKVESIFVGE